MFFPSTKGKRECHAETAQSERDGRDVASDLEADQKRHMMCPHTLLCSRTLQIHQLFSSLFTSLFCSTISLEPSVLPTAPHFLCVSFLVRPLPRGKGVLAQIFCLFSSLTVYLSPHTLVEMTRCSFVDCPPLCCFFHVASLCN